jgi:nuclear pore complex protein Nup54
MAFSFGNLGSNTGGAEKKTGTLFGSTTAPPGGLFGQPSQQQPQTNTTQQPSTGGLFGSSTQPSNTGGLFGGSTQQTTTGGGLFGSTQPQNTGAFGASTQQPSTGQGLFGQPQQQNSGTGSLFGQPQIQTNPGVSLFSPPQQPHQQAQQPPNLSNSLFGASLQPAPSLNQSQAQSVQQQREGLPQLRQSSAQPYASSSINGHSTRITSRIGISLTIRRRKVGRRADTRLKQQVGPDEPRLRLPILLLQLCQARRSALLRPRPRRG